MDTISIKINFKKELNISDIKWLENSINGFRSQYNFTFCDVLEFKGNTAIVKISYPRYFKGSNAFLISSPQECLEVNSTLYNALTYKELQYEILDIELIRVDIPFTYTMSNNEFFHNYKNIYKIFAEVYERKNINACPKMISQIISENPETLIYSNTKVSGNYNSKVQIYNQYQNLCDKNEDESFRKIIEVYPDLSKRIRMEVSKRINRNSFTLEQFGNYDIHSDYYDKHRKYLLDNFFDMSLIDAIYEELAIELSNKLESAISETTFKYEVFLLYNLKNMYDYKILRRALELKISNKKTLESAVTRVRKILEGYEKNEEIIVLDTYKHIKKMYEQFS